MRKKTIKMIRDAADEIDKHYRNVKTSKLVGAGTAIAGGAMTLGGGIATLATGGAAAPVTIPVIATGATISAAGRGPFAGASIIADATIIPKLQEQIDADNEILQELLQLKNENHSEAELSAAGPITRAGSGVSVGGRAAATAVRAGKNVPRLGQVGRSVARGGAAAVEVGRVALQVAAAAGIVVEIVVIPLNIAEIVTSGMSLYRGSETKASRKLREKAKEYEEQMNAIITLNTPDSQDTPNIQEA